MDPVTTQSLEREPTRFATDVESTTKQPNDTFTDPQKSTKRYVRRKRKPTYLVQQEEKDALRKEQMQLELQLNTLQMQGQIAMANNGQAILYKELVNGFLKTTLREQQHSMAELQSVLSAYVERHAVLRNLRKKKLDEARRYITERSRCADPFKPYIEESKFEAANGDYCMAHFDVTPFEGIDSVKSVVDALHFYFTNIEIHVSEMLGEITISSDEDSSVSAATHHRMISSVTNNVQLEINIVRFWDYQDQQTGNSEPGALITVDFVDQDDMFPYYPNKYIRQDVTSVLRVQSHKRTKINAMGEEEEETVIVLTRCAFLRLHRTDLPISAPVWQFLRENIGRWGDLMIKTVREMLYPGYPHTGYTGSS